MGSKTAARRAAVAAGVPVVPGTEQPFGGDEPESAVEAAAARIGYPLLIKAVAGGGGKGMRRGGRAGELSSAIRAARSEAGAAFGDAAIYLERRLVRPRHIEVQLLGDLHGTVLPFVERECSIQRRHQKVIEETPSPAVSPALRTQITAAAARVARSVGYTSAGTIEFLLDEDGHFCFLEMNTRLQVEHPITEMVTGVDLVAVADSHRARRAARYWFTGRADAQRPRDRMPDLRGRSGHRLHAVAGPHHRAPRAGRPMGPRRRRCGSRRRRPDFLRSADFEACRPGVPIDLRRLRG